MPHHCNLTRRNREELNFRQRPRLAIFRPRSQLIRFSRALADKTLTSRVKRQLPPRPPRDVPGMTMHRRWMPNRLQVGIRPLAALHAIDEVLKVQRILDPPLLLRDLHTVISKRFPSL